MAVPAPELEPEPTVAEAARLIVELTRAQQGLPFHVEDPATLHRIAQLISPRND